MNTPARKVKVGSADLLLFIRYSHFGKKGHKLNN